MPDPRKDKHLTLRIHPDGTAEILGHPDSIGLGSILRESPDEFVMRNGWSQLIFFRKDGSWGKDYHKVWFIRKEEGSESSAPDDANLPHATPETVDALPPPDDSN